MSRRRELVKPGLTGLWQVRGRSTNDIAEWIRLDDDYARERSLRRDPRHHAADAVRARGASGGELMDVAVIGAGPGGLATAMRLAQAGTKVVVYESASEVGGLARSLELWDRRVDLGSHVVADDIPGVADLLGRLLGDRVHRVPLRRAIVLDGRSYAYPLRPLNIARTGGPGVALRLSAGAVRRHRRSGSPAPDGSAEQWVTTRFGRAFHDSFFKPYAEKLFGIPTSTIDASFACRLVGVDADAGDEGAARRVWDRVHPAPSKHGRARDFLYPSDGLGALSDGLAAAARAAGAQFRTSTKVDRLDIRDGRALGIESDAGVRPFDAVAAAVPFPVLSRLVDAPPDIAALVDGLRTRATVLVYLAVDDESRFAELWRYLCDPGSRIGRVANLARWQRPDTATPHFPRTLLCCEIWCDPGDDTWRADDEDLAATAIDELHRANLVAPSTVAANHVVRVPGTHLVPRLGTEHAVEKVRAYLGSIAGLYTVGRGGGAQDVGSALHSGLVVADAVLRSSATPMLRMEK